MDTDPWPNLLKKLKNEHYENILIRQHRRYFRNRLAACTLNFFGEIIIY